MKIDWKQKMRESFTSWEKLATFLEWDETLTHNILKKAHFPLLLPKRLAEKVEKKTLFDPILAQFLPTKNELLDISGFVDQPVADETFQKSSSLLQKYSKRALLLATGACAMNCRFCFRQNYPYESKIDLSQALKTAKNDPSIEEIILSGGDPLARTNEWLQEVIGQLNEMPQVRRLRFHTRFPMGIPERIDESFLEVVSSFRGVVYFVIHTNHPKEWDKDIEEAMLELRKKGFVLMSQTVLLKGINDDLATLTSLFTLLANLGIIPYYLHQLDKIKGSSHFEVDPIRGRELIKGLRESLSGYAVPQYVQEIPHEKSKTPL